MSSENNGVDVLGSSDARLFAPCVAVGTLGLALAVAAWFLVAAYEEERAREDLDDDAQTHAQALQAGLDNYMLRLLAIRSMYAASPTEVTRAEFVLFSNELTAINPGDGHIGYSWVPRVLRLVGASRVAARAGAS